MTDKTPEKTPKEKLEELVKQKQERLKEQDRVRHTELINRTGTAKKGNKVKQP